MQMEIVVPIENRIYFFIMNKMELKFDGGLLANRSIGHSVCTINTVNI